MLLESGILIEWEGIEYLEFTEAGGSEEPTTTKEDNR